MSNSISTNNIKRLLISHNIFVAGRVFFEIFLNVFIWEQTEDLTLIAWFNIAYLLMHTILFHVFAYFVKNGKVHFSRAAALSGFALTYLIIYLLKEQAIDFVIPIAIAIGIFNGMYWISYQVLRFDLTNNKNRGNYAGMEFGAKMFVDVVMPVLGGAIIVVNFFGWGYSNLFLVGTILFFVSLIIGNVEFPIYDTSNFHIKKTFSLLRKDKDIMRSMWGYVLGSFGRGGTIVRLILPLLIYDTMRDELQLGGWLSFFSVVAIISSLSFGKLVDYKNYKNYLLFGGVVYSSLFILILLYPSFLVYILFGALIKIVDLFIKIPKRVISENLIHSVPEENNHRVEYIVIREWFNIGLGRLSVFLVLLTVNDLEVEQMKILLLLIASAVLAETFLIRSIKEDILRAQPVRA